MATFIQKKTIHIKNKLLKENRSSLKHYFKTNANSWKELLKAYCIDEKRLCNKIINEITGQNGHIENDEQIKASIKNNLKKKSDNWKQLLKENKTNKDSFFDEKWEIFQKDRNEEITKQISSAISNGSKTLVVLMLGFNQGKSVSDYDELEKIICEKNLNCNNAVFLEVYWDGFEPGYNFTEWPGIQLNSHLVGKGVWKFLKEISDDTPVRILTDNRGAEIINAAFWNFPNLIQIKDVDEVWFFNNVKIIRNKDSAKSMHGNIRIVMQISTLPNHTLEKMRMDIGKHYAVINLNLPYSRSIAGENYTGMDTYTFEFEMKYTKNGDSSLLNLLFDG